MTDSARQSSAKSAAAETTTISLSQLINATPKPSREGLKDQVQTLVDLVLKEQGVPVFKKSVDRTIRNFIKAIDEQLSTQLAAVMHNEEFLKLEGTWRGLRHLVMNSETGADLKIKALNVSKAVLFKDIDKAEEFDQSQLWKKVYESEFGQDGGAPFAALIGDYQFGKDPEDIALLEGVAGVAAAAFAPFITSPEPSLLGLETWTDLSKPRDLSKVFEGKSFVKWRAFRERPDSRFVCMTMPRALARLPYGKETKSTEGFNFEEAPEGLSHEQYCWMNAAYVYGARLTDAYARYGWCTAVRGVENGGKVEGLPTHVVKTPDGDEQIKCPAEVLIPQRRDAELGDLGFLPLVHFKNTDYAVFFSGQTVQKPTKFQGKNGVAATENAAISARIPYVMATSRLAHYLKVIARDKIGSGMEASDCQDFLNEWIQNYCNDDPKAGEKMRAAKPFREATVEVRQTPGMPGHYEAVANLRPWLQMESLTAALQLVASIPTRQ